MGFFRSATRSTGLTVCLLGCSHNAVRGGHGICIQSTWAYRYHRGVPLAPGTDRRSLLVPRHAPVSLRYHDGLDPSQSIGLNAILVRIWRLFSSRGPFHDPPKHRTRWSLLGEDCMNTPPSVISASVWENLASYASVSLVVSRFYPCVHSLNQQPSRNLLPCQINWRMT